MSPADLRLLLHYYAIPSDPPEATGEAGRLRLTDLLVHELIVPRHADHGPTYELTQKGEAFCEALMNVPLPIQRWVMP
jgi:hypothetical protein